MVGNGAGGLERRMHFFFLGYALFLSGLIIYLYQQEAMAQRTMAWGEKAHPFHLHTLTSSENVTSMVRPHHHHQIPPKKLPLFP